MATSEQVVGRKRKHKFARDKSALGIPGSRFHKAPSERTVSGSSASSSVSSSCSTSNSSYLSSAASSRRSRLASIAAAGYRPSTGIHYLSWFIPRYLVRSAAEDGCKPLIPAENDLRQHKNEENCNKEREVVPSPLHDKKKITWLATHTDDHIRSLPFPPPYHPPILNFPTPHAQNIASAFRRQCPPVSYYCRHSCPCSHQWALPNFFLPSTFPSLPQPAEQSAPLPPPPPSFPLPKFQPDPPPQSMFTNVGIAPRRNFTVHPDWRRVRRQ